MRRGRTSRAVKAVAVAHPRAARRPAWKRLEALLGKRGVEVDLRLSRRPGHARGLAREAAPRADRLLAVGGDGTLHQVVNGMLEAFPPGLEERPPPLAVVPMGTGNDFARALELPRDPAGLARILSKGRRRPVDAGRLKVIQGEAWRSLYFVGSSTWPTAATTEGGWWPLRGLCPTTAIWIWW